MQSLRFYPLLAAALLLSACNSGNLPAAENVYSEITADTPTLPKEARI